MRWLALATVLLAAAAAADDEPVPVYAAPASSVSVYAAPASAVVEEATPSSVVEEAPASTTGDEGPAGTGVEEPTEHDVRVADDDGGNRCARYAKQIQRYRGDLELARERDDDVWEQATEDQLERLRANQKQDCPEPPAPNPMIAVARFLKKAGKLALTAAQLGLL